MPLEYKALLNTAHSNIILGRSIVVDAPFGAFFANENYIDDLRKRCGWEDDIKIVVICVTVEPKELRRRMIARNNERDHWKLEHWDTYIKSLEAKPVA